MLTRAKISVLGLILKLTTKVTRFASRAITSIAINELAKEVGNDGPIVISESGCALDEALTHDATRISLQTWHSRSDIQ